MGQNLTDRIASCPEERRLLEQERLILDATELICEAMQSAGVSRTDLAKKLGRTKGYVSQLLDGSRNMTLRTLTDILMALDRRLELHAPPLTRTKVQETEACIMPRRPSLWCLNDALIDSPHLVGEFDGQVA